MPVSQCFRQGTARDPGSREWLSHLSTSLICFCVPACHGARTRRSGGHPRASCCSLRPPRTGHWDRTCRYAVLHCIYIIHVYLHHTCAQARAERHEDLRPNPSTPVEGQCVSLCPRSQQTVMRKIPGACWSQSSHVCEPPDQRICLKNGVA